MLFKRALIGSVFAFAALPALAIAATPTSATTTQPATATQPAAAPKPVKATPEQRAEAERLDPLGRSAFWAREVDADPMDADARLKLAKALRALGRDEEASEAADQLLVIQPNNLEAMLESARDKIENNQGFYAIDIAERAAAQAPRDWRPVGLLAIALEQSDRDADALQAYQKALSLAPDNPAPLTNLGMYYAGHGDAARAETLLRKAATEPGAAAQERQNLALVLGLEGKYDEAEQLARQDLPPDQVKNNLAYLRADSQGPQPRTWESLKAVQ